VFSVQFSVVAGLARVRAIDFVCLKSGDSSYEFLFTTRMD